MKTIKSLRYAAVGLLTACALTQTSCSSDYMDTVPTEDASQATVSASLDNLYLALNGIHRKMVSQDQGNQGMGGEPGQIICREALGDDMTWDTQSWHKGFLNWSFPTNATSANNYNFWETYYKFILNANMILESLEANYANSTEPMAKYIKGETLVIRAWSHFQLVQMYAQSYRDGDANSQPGVPYRLKANVEPMARNTVAEVYTLINKDLDEAISLLSGYEAKDINHYTEASAMGIKARVLLAQQKYAEAADMSAKAIEAAKAMGRAIMKPDELMNGFSDLSTKTKEPIYSALTQDDQTVYFYSFYAYMSWNFNSSSVRTGIKCINQETYDRMSPTDLRRQWWDPTGKAAVPAKSYNQRPYQNRKFTARATSNAVGEFAFMRMSELYLMAAEAYARAGQEAKAKEYFDALMVNRDTAYTTTSNTGAALIEEIMDSRRIELWGEGFRWFDLKRLNLPIHRGGSNYDIAFCGFLDKAQGEKGWMFEIPKEETDFNPLMEKNY